MATPIPLSAEPRQHEIKANVLRRQGKVPGVLYGREFETCSLQFTRKEIARAVAHAGTSQFLELHINDREEPEVALVREVQRDPVTGSIVHVDLYRVLAGQTLRSAVPLVQVGTAPALELGGIVSQTLESIEVECLAQDMPASIEVDLSTLEELNSRITVADLPIPEDVLVITPLEMEVAHVAVPRALIEEEEEVEEAELLEGEALEGEEDEAAEGEPTEETGAEDED